MDQALQAAEQPRRRWLMLHEQVGEGTGKQLERRLLSMPARASAEIEEPHDRAHPLQHTRDTAYLDRRISEGKTTRQAMRALKRHISRDLFKRLVEVPLTS